MKKSIFILLLIFHLVPFRLIAQRLTANILDQLYKAEKAMFDASSNGDSSAFRKLCGADYFTINADGSAQTLEDALPNVPRFKGSLFQLSEQRQRVFGNIVLRTGRAKFYFGGQQVCRSIIHNRMGLS